MDLITYRANVSRHIRDAAGVLGTADLDFAVAEAAKRYSRVRPREVVADVPGDGGFDYALPAPYDPEFSRVLQVEYPAGAREPHYVDRLDWTLYKAPAGTVLRFERDTPQVGETVRVTFTALHTPDSVPAAHTDVVTLIAAALACEQLASHYTNASDSTVLADSVDHKSKAAEYAQRAQRFWRLANELLPIPEQGAVQAAGGQTSIGEEIPLLTHRQR